MRIFFVLHLLAASHAAVGAYAAALPRLSKGDVSLLRRADAPAPANLTSTPDDPSSASLNTTSTATSSPLFSGSAAFPEITLEYGQFRGVHDPVTGTDNFLGVPFAQAGRLDNPTLLTRQTRTPSATNSTPAVEDATQYGPSCPQVELIASPFNQQNAVIGQLLGFIESLIAPTVLRQSEDCLNGNVQVPSGINSTSRLPVVMWVHGGGFELGSSAAFAGETTALPGVFYQGANIVQYSQELGQPVVFVSFNHRLNAFGGLAGSEMQAAGRTNLHLKDQRAAMEWVQRYVHLFGGDASRVTIFGESSGAMSIATHMTINDLRSTQRPRNKLFSAAWMFSGAAPRFDPANGARQQRVFNRMLEKTGCQAATDKIACLKAVPFNTYYAAVQSFTSFFSYDSTNVWWYPHPDGTFLRDSPADLAAKGQIADIPFVLGDMRDEGTLFSLVPQLNITTDADFKSFISQSFFPNATKDEVDRLASLYPQDPAAGSPYGTGLANAIGPQYKRLASMVGDVTFQAGRRPFLDRAPNQRKWTYIIDVTLPLLGKVPILNRLGLTNVPILGSFHVSDAVLYIFGLLPRSISTNSQNIMAGLIRFAYTQDPSPAVGSAPAWPRYDSDNKLMYNFREDGPTIIKDDFRVAEMAYINSNPNKHFNF